MIRRVLVIGAMGMLGRVLFARLHHTNQIVAFGTYNKATPFEPSDIMFPFDVTEVSASLGQLVSKADVIVNCAVSLGSSMKDGNWDSLLNSFQVNSVFPRRLSKEAERQGVRIIHISSDAVFSGNATEPLSEDAVPDPADLYGVSKLLGEDQGPNIINIRTSIVGFDETYRRGLLEWFLSHQPGSSIKGFVNHIWQGVTTVQLADLITTIVQSDAFDHIRQEGPVHHFCPNDAVSKFELLSMFNQVFQRNTIIEPAESSHGGIHRRLKTNFTSLLNCYQGSVGMKVALEELKEIGHE
jgi:dTDP-4-dehydrorhamnose reductase